MSENKKTETRFYEQVRKRSVVPIIDRFGKPVLKPNGAIKRKRICSKLDPNTRQEVCE